MFSRLITYIVVIFLFASAGLVVAPIFVDLGKYKSDFSTVIKNFTGVEPIIEGRVNVSFFPTPSITIGRITVPNVEGASEASIFVADGVEAQFTFSSLLKGKFDPSSITLIRPRLELEKMDNGDKNWVKLFENNNKSKINESLNIPLNITIKNGTIVYSKDTLKTNIDHISSDLKISSAQGPFAFKGNFLLGEATLNFTGNMGFLSENSTAEFNINSDSFDFNMKGNYRPGTNFDIHGNSSLDIKDMSKFIDAFFSEEPLMAQIKSNESLAVKGDFLVSNEITSFNKLSIDADSIKGKGNVDILYGSGKDSGIQWDIALNIDKINIDTLRTSKNKPKTDNPDVMNYYTAGSGSINLTSYHFELPTDLSALFTLSVGEIVYNNDKISNILIDTDIFNGKGIIHSFSAELPGNSKIELTGNVDHNGSRPLFIGKIRAYGDNLRKALIWLYPPYSFIPDNELKEFLFSCDLDITPRKMTVSNIYGSVDKSLLNGSLFVRPSDNIPSIKADIKLDRLDFDRYNATRQIDSYIRDFFITARDKNLETSWLKIFNYKLALSVTGDEIVYNGNNIKNFATSIGVVKGLMNVQSILIDSDLAKIQGKINVDLNKDIPELNVDLNSKYFDTSAFIINSEENQDKEEVSATPETNVSIWSKDKFNLIGIDRFNGNMNFAFDVLKIKNFTLKDLNLKGALKKDVFAISDFNSKWGEKGKINIKGNIGVSKEAPSIGVSVIGSNIDAQDVFHAIGSKNNMKGDMYVGCVLKTFGLSPFEWAKEFSAKAKVAIRNAEIQGVDISTIIEQSRKLYSVIDMNVVLKKATSEGSTRFFAMDGMVNVDKSILQAKDIVLATDKSRGVFSGNLSIHTLKMRGLAKVSYLPEANKTVTLNFDLDGTFPDDIKYKLDSSNLEQYITGKANK